MTEENKEIKIEFAPGAFDHFDGTQEELDALMNEIQSMFANLSKEDIEAMGKPMTEEDWEDLPEEAKLQIVRSRLEDEEGVDLAEEFKRKLQ